MNELINQLVTSKFFSKTEIEMLKNSLAMYKRDMDLKSFQKKCS